MAENVKTTRIEKKYTDKKTGKEEKITIEYAKAVDRLKAFREKYPNGKTHTIVKTEGSVVAKAYVWKDKTEFMELLSKNISPETALLSCDATGTAEQAKENDKKVEKLETIALARALAQLGFASDGRIASDEEMEAFEEFKLDKITKEIEEAVLSLESCTTLPDLQKEFLRLRIKIRGNEQVIAVKDRKKGELSEN